MIALDPGFLHSLKWLTLLDNIIYPGGDTNIGIADSFVAMGLPGFIEIMLPFFIEVMLPGIAFKNNMQYTVEHLVLYG